MDGRVHRSSANWMYSSAQSRSRNTNTLFELVRTSPRAWTWHRSVSQTPRISSGATGCTAGPESIEPTEMVSRTRLNMADLLPDRDQPHRATSGALDLGRSHEDGRACCRHLPQVRDQFDSPLSGREPGFVSGVAGVES